jgi:hypothetical protein
MSCSLMSGGISGRGLPESSGGLLGRVLTSSPSLRKATPSTSSSPLPPSSATKTSGAVSSPSPTTTASTSGRALRTSSGTWVMGPPTTTLAPLLRRRGRIPLAWRRWAREVRLSPTHLSPSSPSSPLTTLTPYPLSLRIPPTSMAP